MMELEHNMIMQEDDAPTVPIATDLDFDVVFPNASALRTLVEIMTNVLVECIFRIDASSADSVLLRVDAMDSANICACKAKIKSSGRVYKEEQHENTFFCIKLKPFLEVLKALPISEGVRLFRHKGQTMLNLVSLGVEAHKYELNTLVTPYHLLQLDPCRTNFSIDFDLAKLKSHLRVISNLKADTIKITISEITAATSPLLGGLVLTLSCTGEDVKARWDFVQHDGAHATFPEKEIDTLDRVEKYCEEFSSEFLKNFTKSMERNSVTLSFTSDEPRVLLLEYALGLEASNITFLLAPKCSL